MKCLCCGKEIMHPSVEESASGWHRACVRKFFDSTNVPELDLTKEGSLECAKQSTAKKSTVAGVQKKLSLHISKMKDRSRITIVNEPAGYILKPQSDQFSFLPELEHAAMLMGKECGLKVVPNGLIRTNDSTAYITRRIDRQWDSKGTVRLHAMEDFCQLLERQTTDKYLSSYEKCTSVIKKYSIRPGIDLSEFFMRIVFCLIIGNSDMHLKNFSLIETDPASREFVLSEAYDLLPVNVILPEDEEETALTLNGKKKNIRRKDLLILADKCDIPRVAANRMIDSICARKKDLLAVVSDMNTEEHLKTGLGELIEQRTKRIAS